MQLYALPPDRLSEAWPLVEPFARKIADRFGDDWPVSVTFEAAQARTLQLWLIWDEEQSKPAGVVGTRIIDRPSGKRKLDIPWTAGERREEWMHLLSQIEDYGRAEGCQEVEFTARWGWQPDLPEYHCEKLAVFRKELRTNAERQAA